MSEKAIIKKIQEAIACEKEAMRIPADCGYSGTQLHGYTLRILESLLEE